MALGAPAETRLAHGYSPLHRAARRGDFAQGLLDQEAGTQGLDALDAAGDTPLVLAVRWRNEDAAQALLNAGANPNASNEGWSVLADAAYQDSSPNDPTHFVDRLLKAGGNPNPPGYPPLFCTVNQEWWSGPVLQLLTSAGANIEAVAGPEAETVLHRIAWIADAGMVDFALDAGAAIEARDGEGRTPLLAAAAGSNVETFLRLAERGADLDARDASSRSVDQVLDNTAEADEIRAFVERIRATASGAGEREP